MKSRAPSGDEVLEFGVVDHSKEFRQGGRKNGRRSWAYWYNSESVIKLV